MTGAIFLLLLHAVM